MSCKKCVHREVCPLYLKEEDAKRCKHYKDQNNLTEIVRCKDCSKRVDGSTWCKVQARYTKDTDYCSEGVEANA